MLSQSDVLKLRELACRALEGRVYNLDVGVLDSGPFRNIMSVAVKSNKDSVIKYTIYFRNDYLGIAETGVSGCWKIEVLVKNNEIFTLGKITPIEPKHGRGNKPLKALWFFLTNLFDTVDADARNYLSVRATYFMYCTVLETIINKADHYQEKGEWATTVSGIAPNGSRIYLQQAKISLIKRTEKDLFTLDLWSPEAGFLHGDNVRYIIDSLSIDNESIPDLYPASLLSRYDVPVTFARRVKLKT
jgi:hypothetical protein